MFSWIRVLVVGISATGYAGLNAVCALKIEKPAGLGMRETRDYIGQHISLVHSILACILSIIVYIGENGLNYEGGFNINHILVMGHTLGYFMYDMIYAEVFGIHDLPMRFHHICAMLGGFLLYSQENGGSLAIASIILTEISNPFMEVRLIYKMKKAENTKIYKIAELAFVWIFIFSR